MVARARLLQARVLPRGWLDVLRQVALFAAAYLAYRLVRGLVEGDANAAFAHARDVISLELTLHIFVEPSIQAWASGSRTLMDFLELAVRQRADDRHGRGARLPVPAPQPQLLLRAQHVRDRDVHRADRLHRVPDGAAAVHARMGLHRLRLERHRRARLARERLAERAGQPLRRRPLDARLLRADDRLAARAPGAASRS